jgi:enterochelin esterase-like enzyme
MPSTMGGLDMAQALLLAFRRFRFLVLVAIATLGPVADASGAQGQHRVLFIGNSYTYFNNLPELVGGLAAAGRKGPLATEMVAPGGWRLQDHLKRGEARERLTSGRWDAVVLQEQSTMGVTWFLDGLARIGADAEFQTSATAWRTLLGKRGIRTVFYMTWAREASPEDQPLLTAAYMKAAQGRGSEVSPVGIAWDLARREGLGMELFGPDGSHPAPAGSYLAACTLYATLFLESPEGLPGRLEGAPVNLDTGLADAGKRAVLVDLPPPLARRLQQLAWKAVQELTPDRLTPVATPVALPSLQPLPTAPPPRNPAGLWSGWLRFFPEGEASMRLRIAPLADRWTGRLELTYGKRIARSETHDVTDVTIDEKGLRFTIPASEGVDKLGISFAAVEASPGRLQGHAISEARRGDVSLKFEGSFQLRHESTPDPALEVEFGKGPALEAARLALAGNVKALDDHLTGLRAQWPLVETDPSAPERRIVTLLFRGDASTRKVLLPYFRVGPFHNAADASGPARGQEATPFKRLGESQLWYLRLNVPRGAVFGYTIAVERTAPSMPGGVSREEVLDPLNPQTLGLRGDVSILRLPDATFSPWVEEDPLARKGQLVRGQLHSKVLNGPREFSVYIPAGGARDAKLAVVFDGEFYTSGLGAPALLDRLIHDGKVPRILAVFVDAGQSRDRDLVNDPAFASFVAQELRPYILNTYSVSAAPEDAVVAGLSFGGLTAARIALAYPDAFGKVLSLSGAFWPPTGWTYTTPSWAVHEQESALINAYVNAPRKALDFYLACGLYESAILTSNRQLRDVLRAKGYPVTYVEYPGTHSAVHWGHGLGDGLVRLFSGEGSR